MYTGTQTFTAMENNNHSHKYYGICGCAFFPGELFSL